MSKTSHWSSPYNNILIFCEIRNELFLVMHRLIYQNCSVLTNEKRSTCRLSNSMRTRSLFRSEKSPFFPLWGRTHMIFPEKLSALQDTPPTSNCLLCPWPSSSPCSPSPPWDNADRAAEKTRKHSEIILESRNRPTRAQWFPPVVFREHVFQNFNTNWCSRIQHNNNNNNTTCKTTQIQLSTMQCNRNRTL